MNNGRNGNNERSFFVSANSGKMRYGRFCKEQNLGYVIEDGSNRPGQT